MSDTNINRPNVVPFGKYKGQPIEVMAEDPSYVEWLNGQGWVKDKYPQFYTVIINNFAEPSDTPEHNAIQVLFLEEEFCLRFLSAYLRMYRHGDFLHSEYSAYPRFECKGIDVLIDYVVFRSHSFGSYEKEIGEWFNAGREGIRRFCIKDALHECSRDESCAIEIKPSLGDDFPSVLRQAIRMEQGFRCVVFRDFVATSVTLEQVRAMFKSSGVLLFSLAEIQQAEIDTRYDEWYAANIEQEG